MWILVVIFFLLFVFFDASYFIRGLYYTVLLKWRVKFAGKRNIFDEVTTEGICTTNDLDFLWHMNNSRYLRECDFGRYNLWISNGIYSAVSQLGGFITLGGSTIRYRKSLELGDSFQVRSKVVGWDERAFFLEQTLIRKKDGFICAIVFLKQSLVKVTPEDAVAKAMGSRVMSPELPEEFQLWIKSNQISSEKLRKSS